MDSSTDKAQTTDPAANNAAVAVSIGYPAVEAAVKKLADANIDMKHLSMVGKGHHTVKDSMRAHETAIEADGFLRERCLSFLSCRGLPCRPNTRP